MPAIPAHIHAPPIPPNITPAVSSSVKPSFVLLVLLFVVLVLPGLAHGEAQVPHNVSPPGKDSLVPSLFKGRASLSGIGVVYEQKSEHGGLLSLNTVPAGGLSTLIGETTDGFICA